MVRIYGLICPKEQKILYIGKTSLTLNRRLGQHLNKAYLNKTKKDKWLDAIIVYENEHRPNNPYLKFFVAEKEFRKNK